MNCQKIPCFKTATKKPFISFTSLINPDGPRVTAEIGVYLCDDHADTNPSAYVSDIGWDQICKELHRGGKAKPDRKSLRVEFIEVQE
jgi:hypothetical protein